MAFIPSTFAAPLPDGVYLNLSEEEYFAQETRGSSDWIACHQKKWGWWWSSPYNPDRARVKKVELTYGSALHAIICESVAAYEARFIPEPDPLDYVDIVDSVEEMKSALDKAGYVLSGTSKWKKADWALAMEQNMPDRACWSNILRDFNDRLGPEDRPGRKKIITALEDRQLRLLREVALGDFPGNEEIKQLFAESADHPPLAEVSVICTIDGIRRRWRFDRMFPRFDLDLKSLDNFMGRPLPWAVGELLARRGWDIQRADHLFGRQVAYELIRAGKLFGGTIEQRKWLATWPDAHPTWDYVWLCYQKPDPAGRAPVVFPVWDDSWGPADPTTGEAVLADLVANGAAKLQSAIAFYKSAVAEFGLDRPWAAVAPLHYTDENEKRRLYFPHWMKEVDPTEADAYEGGSPG